MDAPTDLESGAVSPGSTTIPPLLDTPNRNKTMPTTKRNIVDRIRSFRAAWRELAADSTFAGMTLAEFEAASEPSLALRADIVALEKQIQGKSTLKSKADDDAVELLQLVVGSVRGTPGFGRDSALYRALGYVRHSERRSGLSRKTSSPAGDASAA
jgi:hypothetical protein